MLAGRLSRINKDEGRSLKGAAPTVCQRRLSRKSAASDYGAPSSGLA